MLYAATKWVAPVLAALALTALQAPSAQAGFTVSIYENGSATAAATFSDSGTGTIQLTGADINGSLTYFNFLGLTATSTGSTGTPGSTDKAEMTVTVSLDRQGLGVVDPTGIASVKIVAIDDQFSFPSGNPKYMTTSASNTFSNDAANSQRTFQSTFDNGTDPAVSSALATFIPTDGNLSPGQPDRRTDVGSATTFTLSSTTVITLGPATDEQKLGASSTTKILAVPEPGSMALGLISLPALLALGRRMRRRVEA